MTAARQALMPPPSETMRQDAGLAPRADDQHRDRPAQDRQVDGKQEKAQGQHPDPENGQEGEQPPDDQKKRHREADRKPAVSAQRGHRTAERGDQPLQRVELPLEPAFPSLSCGHCVEMDLHPPCFKARDGNRAGVRCVGKGYRTTKPARRGPGRAMLALRRLHLAQPLFKQDIGDTHDPFRG